MNIVKNHIDRFTRGGDPYKKLNVGSYRIPPIKSTEVTHPDGLTITTHILTKYEDMRFPSWDQAMDLLVTDKDIDENEYLYDFLHGEMSTNDEVVMGDQTIVGIDIMDHL